MWKSTSLSHHNWDFCHFCGFASPSLASFEATMMRGGMLVWGQHLNNVQTTWDLCLRKTDRQTESRKVIPEMRNMYRSVHTLGDMLAILLSSLLRYCKRNCKRVSAVLIEWKFSVLPYKKPLWKWCHKKKSLKYIHLNNWIWKFWCWTFTADNYYITLDHKYVQYLQPGNTPIFIFICY